MTAKYGSKIDIQYKSFTPTQNQDRLNMRLFEVNFRPRQIIMKLSNTIAVKFKKNHMNKGELELGLQLDLDLGQKFRT